MDERPGRPLGYADGEYAESLREVGDPRHLAACDGWVLVRRIRGGPARDATGCYPLFACLDWSQLPADIAALDQDLVSLTLVTDPFAPISAADLGRVFDVVRPFKTHHVAELRQPPASFVTRDHRRCARSAHNRGVRVHDCPSPPAHVDEWAVLYHHAMAALGVPADRVFTRASLAAQLEMEGLRMLRVEYGGRTIGYGQFLIGEDVAYAHLAAYAPDAVRVRASCALYAAAIDLLEGQVRWIDWGGNAGLEDDPSSTLAHFKRGWSTGHRMAYLCGRIYDRDPYDALTAAVGAGGSAYFPAYRSGEV